MKYIIAGGRDFDQFDLMCETCEKIIAGDPDVEIVSGAAVGADKLGEQYAKLKEYRVKQFPADWSLGRKAGPLRNIEMSKYGDVLIAFWDGESRGTKHMITIAKERDLDVHVIHYTKV